MAASISFAIIREHGTWPAAKKGLLSLECSLLPEAKVHWIVGISDKRLAYFTPFLTHYRRLLPSLCLNQF